MSERRPRGYWMSLENTVKEAQKAMEKEGWETLPRSKILKEKGYGNLEHAINRYHGGIQTFRERFGQGNPQKPSGYWQSLDNTMREVQQAMEEEGWETLPSQGVLNRYGYSMLSSAISKYHNGFFAFRKLLGENINKKQNGYWQSLDNTIQEAQQVMEKEGWETLPDHKGIYESGYGSLSVAIIKYHGGFPAFRELLRTHTNQPSESEQIKSLLEKYVNGGTQDG